MLPTMRTGVELRRKILFLVDECFLVLAIHKSNWDSVAHNQVESINDKFANPVKHLHVRVASFHPEVVHPGLYLVTASYITARGGILIQWRKSKALFILL
jgi:hypothetical protein